MAWTEEQQAEAVAILREMVEEEPLAVDREDYNYCIYCGANNFRVTPLVHRDDCLWVRVKRLVAGGTVRRG